MAYITGSENYVIDNATTKTMTIPATSTGDVVFLIVVAYRTAPITSVVGNNGGTWTLSIDASGGSDDSFVYTCVQGATPDTTVTLTFTAADYACINIFNCKEVDTTTPIEVSSFASQLVQRDIPIPSITTTTDNGLVVYAVGARSFPVYPQEGLNIQCADETASSFYFMTVTTDSKIVAGATGAQTWNHATNYGAGNYSSTYVVFSIKDAGSGHIQPALDRSALPYQYLLTMSRYDGGLVRGNWYDPTSVSYEGLTSLSQGSYTNSNLFARESTVVVDALKPGFRSIASATTSNTYSDYVILTGYPITETYGTVDNYDLSGKLICVSNKASDPRTHPDSDIGGNIAISDQTNARFWQLGTTNSVPSLNDGTYPTVIDVDDPDYVMDDIGTPNTSSVGAIIIGSEPTTSYINTFFSPIFVLGTLKAIGGSSVVPASFKTFADHASANILNTVLAQGGLASGQFIVCQDTQCGGASAVYWDCSNQSAEWPSAYDSASKRRNFKFAAGRLTHTINAISGSTVRYNSSTLNFGNYHNFVLNSSVPISSTGLSILNANVTLTSNAGSSLSGITFSGCKELVSSVDLSGGNTISNCVDAQAITVTSQAEFQKLANCTFRNNTVAIKITGNQTGTWTDANLTVSGNTYDIEYTGTTNFSIQSAATLTVNNSSTGTLTVVTPTFDLVVNSSETASQINVFSTGTQTVIDSEASASSLTYTHSGETVDITVLKDGYIPFRQTGVVLSGSVTIDVQLVKSREYLASHGLTYTTDASWDRSTNKLTVPTWGVTGQQVFSLIMEAFKSETSLRNTAFNLQMDGASSLYLVNGAEGASDASITNMIECGVAYLDSSGTTTASWVGVKSVGTATGFTGEYQQDAGGVLSGTVDARATGIFNQLIKMYGDVTHGNFDYTDHLVLKYQPNGYREVRSDVLEAYGISTLSPTLYIVAMQPVAIAAATGDPALTLTITDHGASPVTWNSKAFSITVVADATDSGENILRELNYNLSLDATYQGKDPFNWPEMVIEAGTAYETKRGITEGGTGAALKGVRVIDGSGNPHPDFTRMQADDGTYYVVPITANISISNLPDDVGGNTRLQIYNITTATLIYSGDPAGTSYSDSYTDGDPAYASAGDNIRIRFAHANAGTSFEYGQTIVQATSSGIVADGNNFIVAEPVYATNGIDGSTITKFSYTPVNDQFNLIINSNFLAAEMFAFYCYTLTTADGIQGAYGAFVAQDAGNYKNITSITSIYLDNETTASKRQTDTARIYRDDGAYPVLEPTTSGFGIDINWQNVVYVVTAGSGLTAPQAAELTAAASVKATTDQLTFTKANELDINVKSVNGTTIAGSGTELDPWGP